VLVTFAGLAAVQGLAHGVTTRAGGVSTGGFAALNLGLSTGDDPGAVAENRRRAAAQLGFRRFVSAKQVHGTRVAAVASEGDVPGEADALVTDEPGVLLGILGADCPGVVLVDPDHRALAVVHAGWRGTAQGVVASAVRALEERFGTRPAALLTAVGPGISARCYEVGPEVAEALRLSAPDCGAYLRPGAGDRWHVDLAGVLGLQLRALGVPEASIETSGACTHEDAARFFSHRRDGAAAGRHAFLAGFTR
jgi:YfiH family protein